MKLILADINPAMCRMWEKHFANLPDVSIHQGYFEDIPQFDCMVSAANSFGLMDGGVDMAISRFFGWDLQTRVQTRIILEWYGEQPVGTSMIVETKHLKHPFIAHTPTMRVPTPIGRTDYPYVAMWAMLCAVANHNKTADHKINTVVCPGLGTGVGAVPVTSAARQMGLAYKNFLTPPIQIDWRYADQRQNALGLGGDLGFFRRSDRP